MTSIIFARIFGLYFIALGLAFLVSPERFKNMFQQIKNDENFLLLGAILALLIGSVVVSIHNIWMLGWPVIITVLGWWSLFKGAALLIFPSFIELFSFIQNRSNTVYRAGGFVYLILGLFLSYQGWL